MFRRKKVTPLDFIGTILGYDNFATWHAIAKNKKQRKTVSNQIVKANDGNFFTANKNSILHFYLTSCQQGKNKILRKHIKNKVTNDEFKIIESNRKTIKKATRQAIRNYNKQVKSKHFRLNDYDDFRAVFKELNEKITSNPLQEIKFLKKDTQLNDANLINALLFIDKKEKNNKAIKYLLKRLTDKKTSVNIKSWKRLFINASSGVYQKMFGNKKRIQKMAESYLIRDASKLSSFLKLVECGDALLLSDLSLNESFKTLLPETKDLSPSKNCIKQATDPSLYVLLTNSTLKAAIEKMYGVKLGGAIKNNAVDYKALFKSANCELLMDLWNNGSLDFNRKMQSAYSLRKNKLNAIFGWRNLITEANSELLFDLFQKDTCRTMIAKEYAIDEKGLDLTNCVNKKGGIIWWPFIKNANSDLFDHFLINTNLKETITNALLNDTSIDWKELFQHAAESSLYFLLKQKELREKIEGAYALPPAALISVTEHNYLDYDQLIQHANESLLIDALVNPKIFKNLKRIISPFGASISQGNCMKFFTPPAPSANGLCPNLT